MRAALPILLWTWLATPLLPAQEPPPPIPGEESERPKKPEPSPQPAPDPAPRAVKVPLGTKTAKPSVPTVERLLESSEKTKIAADTLWLEIEHAKSRSLTTIDLAPDGNAQLIERVRREDGGGNAFIVRSGKTIPTAVRAAMFDQATKKTVMYGIGRDRLLLGAGSDRLRIGVAANYGRSVHTSQSAPMEEYSGEVREATNALLAAARKLPLDPGALAVVSAEFVDPRQARRLTAVGGQRLIGVKDPGKDATLLPPAVAAARMPGRKIVVADELEWERIKSYLSAAGADPAAGGICLIAVGAQTYRLFVQVVGG